MANSNIVISINRRTVITTVVAVVLLILFFTLNCSDSGMHEITATKKVLDNGLTVIIKEDHKAPLVTIDTWVEIGYLNEPDSLTGISHLLEHMFFKGTEKRGIGELKGDVKRLGGYFNAGTSYDHTHYYITLPAEHAAAGLEIQADALINSVFDKDEFEREKRVVIQEVKRKLDNPTALIYEKMLELMYEEHRLGRWRMGTPEQIEDFTREELVDYYKRSYTPDNSILSIVGDINTNEILTEIDRHFGSWNPGEGMKEYSPEEGKQAEMRRVVDHMDITQPILEMGFKTGGFLEEDSYALQALAYVMGQGRSSRLHRVLVEEKGIASAVSCDLFALKDAGAFSISVRPDTEESMLVQQEIFNQIYIIQEHGITESELQKARNNIESAFFFALEDVANQAVRLAMFEQYGSYTLINEYLDKLRGVEIANIKEVAQTYLDINRANMVEYLPQGYPSVDKNPKVYAEMLKRGIDTEVSWDGAERGRLRASKDYTDNEDFTPVKFTLANGSRLIVKENHSLPVATVVFGFKGGRRYETESNAGITSLMSSVLIKGSDNYSNETVISLIEGAGGRLSSYADRDYFGFQLAIPSKYLQSAIDIVTDLIINPAFNPLEIEIERKKQLAEIEKQKDRMGSYPIQLFYSASYEDSPYGLPGNGYTKSVSNVSGDDLRNWYNQFKSAENLYIAVVGDVSRIVIRDIFTESLVKLTSMEMKLDKPSIPEKSVSDEAVVNREKSQTAQVVGYITCPRWHDDYYALKILQNVASGMGGRLYTELREKQALAYTVFGYNVSYMESGAFICYIATDPKDERIARAGLIEELTVMKNEPVTEEELANAKAYARGRYADYLQQNLAQAELYLLQEIIGKGMGEVLTYPDKLLLITEDDVIRVAKEYFNDDRLSFGVVRGE
ncbi:MAG: hypothetical protein GF315_07305 [candidate division Zixibacteria bacterium]|nr:hypothetical protein [candidate division Zixibacteria bacterium]